MNAEYISAIGRCLVFHGIIDSMSELTTQNFKSKITAFQLQHGGLLADGDPGGLTLWALQEPMLKNAANLKSISVKTDKAPGSGGFLKMSLREDAAAAFEKLAADVRAAGAIVTSAGGFRPLEVVANAHQSARSMHYPGLAFDLATDKGSGGFAPDTDAYVLEWLGGAARRWTVWARATQGQSMTINATFHKWAPNNAVTVHSKIVSGDFINLTEIAGSHGFKPIGARSGYMQPTDKQYMSAEWWHFQYERALVRDFSLLGIEMLKIAGFTPNAIQTKNPALWDERRAIFGDKWV
ncbi:MAG: hypothetical protein GY873_19840 [Bosea sp.]|uniref:hypothetical protein n=1 Tax=Bosea sp. (in: a-proteobacteria) TaxID=1871050 RepID=UPI00238A1B8F|nr:hypothetical protein [Bosea sp. (in: a-proteobacteria)]MCP4736439.1 hypothetical protein [Bosea sp. (in: a-proteobacteria)]